MKKGNFIPRWKRRQMDKLQKTVPIAIQIPTGKNHHGSNCRSNNRHPQWVQKTTTAVFFDFEKAFDTISRRTIMNNLLEMGVSGRMLKFIHNYLNERTIKVKIGNTL